MVIIKTHSDINTRKWSKSLHMLIQLMCKESLLIERQGEDRQQLFIKHTTVSLREPPKHRWDFNDKSCKIFKVHYSSLSLCFFHPPPPQTSQQLRPCIVVFAACFIPESSFFGEVSTAAFDCLEELNRLPWRPDNLSDWTLLEDTLHTDTADKMFIMTRRRTSAE